MEVDARKAREAAVKRQQSCEMAAEHVTRERLRDLFEFSPESGLFIWLARTSNLSRIQIGDVAGNIDTSGYIRIGIDGRMYRAHRLAWLYVTGEWPTADIDHIDGDRANNKWANLREATRSENLQNQRNATSQNKSSGLLGVTWNKQRGKWQAQISLDGKNLNLGYFPTAELAHASYLAEKRELHPFGTL